MLKGGLLSWPAGTMSGEGQPMMSLSFFIDQPKLLATSILGIPSVCRPLAEQGTQVTQPP